MNVQIESEAFGISVELVKDLANIVIESNSLPTKDKSIDSFLLMTNRLVIDAQSVHHLSTAGLYGSAYTLFSSMYRTFRMHVALLVKPELAAEYFDEEVDTFDEKDFKRKFGETALVRHTELVGDAVGQKIEFEKVLHGSAFAIRKYYSKKKVENGKRIPVATFGSYFDEERVTGCLLLAESILLDFAGVYLQQTKGKHMDSVRAKEFLKSYHEWISIRKPVLIAE